MKLDMAIAKKVNAVEARAPQGLLDEGQYKAKLTKVAQSTRLQSNGTYQWVWTFQTLEPVDGATLTERTGLADNQLWTFKRMFDAFGVKPNADTDTLVGKEVCLLVAQLEIEKGPNKGKLTNDISDILPVSEFGGAGSSDDEDWGDDSGSTDEGEPDF